MSAEKKPRVLRPQVINVFDNAVIQVKCEPGIDKVDVWPLLAQSLARFEFVLGTSFDLQFMSMSGKTLYSTQRYIVNDVQERLDVRDINNYQTMSRTVFDRKCTPIGPLFILHEDGEKLFSGVLDEEEAPIEDEAKPEPKAPAKQKNIEDMNPAELQSAMKQLTGKGFGVGKSKPDMVKALRRRMRRRVSEVLAD